MEGTFEDWILIPHDNIVKQYHPKTGTLLTEKYKVENSLHRIDGPAYIAYYVDGIVSREEYFIDYMEHRVDGPAEIWYNRDGTISGCTYALYNKRIIKEEYLKITADQYSDLWFYQFMIATGAVSDELEQALAALAFGSSEWEFTLTLRMD